MTDEGLDELVDHLQRNAAGAEEKVAEGNIHSAFEEFYVGMCVARMALRTDPEDLTPERVELASRLAWAQAELEQGSSARLPDDLELTQTLASEVAYGDA